MKADTKPTDKERCAPIRSVFYRRLVDHPSLCPEIPKEGTPEFRAYELIIQDYPLTTEEVAELGRLTLDIYNRTGSLPDFLAEYAAKALGKMGHTEKDNDEDDNPNDPFYRDRCVDNLARGVGLIRKKRGEPKRKTSEAALFSHLMWHGRMTKKECVKYLTDVDGISKGAAIERIDPFLAHLAKDENGDIYTPMDEIREKLCHRWAELPVDHPFLHVLSRLGGFEVVAQAINDDVLRAVMQALNEDEVDYVILAADEGDLDPAMISFETVLMEEYARYVADAPAKEQAPPT